METRWRASALVLVAAALAGACSPPGMGAIKSPTPSSLAAATPRPGTSPTSGAASPSAAPSPLPVTNPLGVLVANASTGYTVSLVGVDGRVVASAQANRPVEVSCASASNAVVPLPVNTSNTRAYFMDDKGVVRFLAANGDAGRATSVPAGTASRRSLFAVSPDDQRIAVIVIDFTSAGASTRLYVEDLNGGANHLELFSQTGAFTLWPTGWHGTTNLVVAKVPACVQPGGPFANGPQEFHVVDPATAFRRFTVGGPTCVIVGPPSPAGAICENPSNYQVATIYDWTSTQISGFAIGNPTPAVLSPNGKLVALPGDAAAPTTMINPTSVSLTIHACGWIDDTHIVSAGDTLRQARVGDVTTGKIVPVAALGECAGRIPGGL